ncbi:MAG: hypothetical protein AAGK04_12010 [Planctomycetota bacterium]
MRCDLLTEFSIYLADRPGELAGVLESLTVAGTHLAGVSVSVDESQRGLARIIGAPEEAMRHVFEGIVDSGAGPVIEAPVLAVDVSDRPSAFRDIAGCLAAQGINVRYAYQTPALNGFPARCVFRVDEPEAATPFVERLA